MLSVCWWLVGSSSHPLPSRSPPLPRRESLRPGNNPSIAARPAVRCVTPRARPRARGPPAPAADSAFFGASLRGFHFYTISYHYSKRCEYCKQLRKAATHGGLRRGARRRLDKIPAFGSPADSMVSTQFVPLLSSIQYA